jgi:imidazolonepropionase
MKMLRVIHTARKHHAIGIEATYCGGHSVPVGSTAEAATEDIVNVQIPELIVRSALPLASLEQFCVVTVFSLFCGAPVGVRT